MGETFNPQEEAFMNEGDEMTKKAEALRRGETTVAAKKAKEVEKDSDSWYEGKEEAPTDKKF